MTGREELIEEAAKALHEATYGDGSWEHREQIEDDLYRRRARAVLAVFEKAHAPNDDEWMVSVETQPSGENNVWDGCEWHYGVSDVLASVIRRGIADARRPVQGEPTDAQVEAAQQAMLSGPGWVRDSQVRDALRAAAAVREEGQD